MKTATLSKITSSDGNLSEIVRIIVRNADPEKILLISASYDYRITENIFSKNPAERAENSHYSLLILHNSGKTAFLVKSMQSERSIFPVQQSLQLFFMDIDEFNKKLADGDENASKIVSNAMIWYDKGEIPLHFPKL